MTTKEVKQWLWNARGIDREISALQEIRDREYARITSITAQLSGMTVSGTKDPHKYDRLAELDNQIDQLIQKRLETKREILEAISSLEDTRHRTVLSLYYVEGLSVEKICAKMHYSKENIYLLKRQATSLLKK